MRDRLRRTLFLVLTLLLAATVPTYGQDVVVEAQSGPYHVGEPFVVQLSVNGAQAQVDLNCQLKDDPPAALEIEGPQTNRSVRSFTRIINGKMTRSESVDYSFRFVVTAKQEGTFRVGPFSLEVNGNRQEVAGKQFTFKRLEPDPDMLINLSLPQNTIYVGQEVPVEIRWAYAGDIDMVRYAFANLEVRSPLFDKFSFVDEQPRSRTRLGIATAKGTVEIDAEVTQERIDGREFVVVSGTRTLVPDTPGSHEGIPVTCRTEKVTAWQRDLFGDRVAARRQPAFARGEPIDLVVKPIPLTNRPASFAGAVGRGFSIDVSANRSFVRVGDPISLNVTVSGDGKLESVSLPPLSKSAGFSEEKFQLPRDLPAGSVSGNQKQFKVNLRVKDTSVKKIPGVAFSWFNPYEEAFDTVTSTPIALEVMEAQVVSADDVVSPIKITNGSSKQTRPKVGERNGSGAGSKSMVGANLAAIRDPGRLLVRRGRSTATARWAAGCYVAAVIALVTGVIVRRRAGRDLSEIDKRKRLKNLQQRIRASRTQSPQDAAAEVASCLRDLVAEYSGYDRQAVDQLTARCDNVLYATGSTPSIDPEQLAETALRLTQEADIK